MKTIAAIISTILLVILIVSFKPSDSSLEILTVRVSEKVQMSGVIWESEIIIAEPNQETKRISELGKLPKDNFSNLTTINNTLNQITAKGWKLNGVTSAAFDIQELVTIYTFTK